MKSKARLLGLWTIAVCLASCAVIALVDAHDDKYAIGFILGTLFGQTTLAATWVAFGPGRLAWRLPLSLLWVALLIGAVTISIARLSGADQVGIFLLVYGCLLFAQWLFVQLPLWGLAIAYHLGLRGRDEATTAATGRQRQFGIRELMVFTALIALTLGAGRAAVSQISPEMDASARREAPVILFLATAAVLMTLPLVLATLLRGWAPLAALPILAFIAVATQWEDSLFVLLGNRVGPDSDFFVWINAYSTLWVLVFAGIARACGYRLRNAASEPTVESVKEFTRGALGKLEKWWTMIQKPTDRDTTIDDIHRTRERIHDAFAGDIQAILADARKRQLASGRPVRQGKPADGPILPPTEVRRTPDGK